MLAALAWLLGTTRRAHAVISLLTHRRAPPAARPRPPSALAAATLLYSSHAHTTPLADAAAAAAAAAVDEVDEVDEVAVVNDGAAADRTLADADNAAADTPAPGNGVLPAEKKFSARIMS